MVHLSPHPYRVRDAPEETLRRRQGDIRVCLATKLLVLGRKSGGSNVHKHPWVASRSIGAIMRLVHVEDHTFALIRHGVENLLTHIRDGFLLDSLSRAVSPPALLHCPERAL